MADTFLPPAPCLPILAFSLCFFFKVDFDNSDFVAGVFEDTLFDGLQYSLFPPVPQGFPVRVSIHFSFVHLFRLEPAFDFVTFPFFFLHLAVACAARADASRAAWALAFVDRVHGFSLFGSRGRCAGLPGPRSGPWIGLVFGICNRNCRIGPATRPDPPPDQIRLTITCASAHGSASVCVY